MNVQTRLYYSSIESEKTNSRWLHKGKKKSLCLGWEHTYNFFKVILLHSICKSHCIKSFAGIQGHVRSKIKPDRNYGNQKVTARLITLAVLE